MSNPYDTNIIDSRGRMLCKAHRREVCHICCCDHRMCNEIQDANSDEDIDEIVENHGRVQEIEHRAMAQQHAAEGGRGPVILNSERGQHLYDTVAARPNQQQCAQCGMTSDKLSVCSRCKETKYCSKECQLEHYPAHKVACKAAARALKEQEHGAVPAVDPLNDIASPIPRDQRISWRDLEALKGDVATDKILELRILSQPIPMLRHTFEGKDYKGDVHPVAFYADRVPPGLALGKIMRWRNPHFCVFVDGRTGARIEDGDVANISVH